MRAMFESVRAVHDRETNKTIPVGVFIAVTGVDGGCYEVINLQSHQRATVSKEEFNDAFVRWN